MTPDLAITRAVAVFGSSEPQPGSDLYEQSRMVGHELASRQVPVVTGGYSGVMEAVSRGAREADGEAWGVTCALLDPRQPNRWLTREIREPDLFKRTASLFTLSSGFIIVGGKAGTLAELAFLWAQTRAGALKTRIVLLDEFWITLYGDLLAAGRMDEACRETTYCATSPQQAVELALKAKP